MNNIYILLGANLGEPLKQLEKARELLQNRLGEIRTSSSIYESEAWGIEDQPIFYNQVLELITEQDKENSLHICQVIENELGRVREKKWGARLIDIDILYYNDEIYHSSTLTIPHPYIQERKFTLIPLTEIAKDFVHPKFNLTQEQLLLNCTDTLDVKKIY